MEVMPGTKEFILLLLRMLTGMEKPLTSSAGFPLNMSYMFIFILISWLHYAHNGFVKTT